MCTPETILLYLGNAAGVLCFGAAGGSHVVTMSYCIMGASCKLIACTLQDDVAQVPYDQQACEGMVSMR